LVSRKNKQGVSIVITLDAKDVAKNDFNIFVGEYENDNKKGDFKVFKKNEHLLNLKFEGANVSSDYCIIKYLKAEKNKAVYFGGVQVNGQNFLKKGKGILFYDNNHVYVGNFDTKDDKSLRSNEKGKYYMYKAEHPVVMEGVFKDDEITKGTVTRIGDKKLIFDGDFQKNEISNGIYHYDNDETYTGQMSSFKRNGKGIYKFKSGEIYDGEWKDGKRQGDGYYQRNEKTEKILHKWDNDQVVPPENK